jgi:STE24 endopeptidase
MEPFAWIILAIILLHLSFEWLTEILNLKKASPEIPEGFKNSIEPEKYAKSQRYLKEGTHFSLIQTTFKTVILIFFLYSGIFNSVISWSAEISPSPILQALMFFGILAFASMILDTPFSLYSTFSIEARYGFNNMTLKTYITDFIKQLILGAVIGALILSLVILFFQTTKELAWIYCWAALTLIQITLLFVAPIWILPLFNKFIPLPESELKEAIENYAKAQRFSLKGIFTMDGSKRSNKSNAFFTGFGNMRRIVLFDTLVEKYSVDQLLSILAHEMGHCKKKHVFKMIFTSFLTTGLMFYLFSLILNNPHLFSAYQISQPSIYGSLFFFTILFSPIQTVLSLITHYFSRKYEFEADAYAVETIGKPDALSEALTKLSLDHLSNLTPHPLKVATAYSHPPLLQRLKAINSHHC